MIILISPAENIENEISMVNEMLTFNSNFYYHLRKPESDIEVGRKYLKQIADENLKRVVIHQNYELMNEFNLKGVHLKSGKISETPLKITSKSYHLGDEIESENLEYFFCSPVFDSISKKDYPAQEWNINDWNTEDKLKAVALGGINANNIKSAQEKGFENFAFLGAVWNSQNPINSFKELLTHV